MLARRSRELLQRYRRGEAAGEDCSLRRALVVGAEGGLHLQDKGVAVEPVRIDEHTGRRFTFFADPDGLPLELYER